MKHQLWGNISHSPIMTGTLFCIHLQIRSQYIQQFFEASVGSFETSYETVIPFVASSHERSNSNGAMLD